MDNANGAIKANTPPPLDDLLASEARYRRLFETARDGILLADAATGKITDANPYLIELLSCRPEEVLGKELWALGLFKNKEEWSAAISGRPENGVPRRVALSFKSREGQHREFEFVSRVFADRGRQVVQCNLRASVARKPSDEAGRHVEPDYRSLVESSPGIAYLTEPVPPYSLLYISPNIAGFGYAPEDWYGNPGLWLSLLHDDDRERAQHEFRTAANQGLESELEYRIVARNGAIHWWQDKGRFVLDDAGNRLGWQGIILDITKRKQAEDEMARLNAQLEGQRARLNNIVASVPGIVWEAWGKRGSTSQQVDFVSDYVETMIGYSVQEWLERPNFWLSIVHPEDREKTRLLAATYFTSGVMETLEFRWLAKDGRVVWVESSSIAILDEHGQPAGRRGVTLDITGRKRAEDALHESEKNLLRAHKLESVGLLAGGIAHDFNNMLTVVEGYTDLALRRLRVEDPLRHDIEEIRKAGQRAADLTRQLLAFSRQQVLQPVVLDLNQVLVETIKMLQRLIGEDIQLTTSLDPRAGRVLVDPGQLSQILTNLAVNARDAMAPGGKLTIETARVLLDSSYAERHADFLPGDYVTLSVSDSGSGISEESIQHIFDPFFTTKEVGKGTGLGLATVYGIVKQSGGNIEVSSKIGIGTTFKVYLPRITDQVHRAAVTDSTDDMPNGTETILLVEDEEMVRKLSRAILETCGYRVIEAINGVDALSMTGTIGPIDLLMTDVVMPKMGGRELAEKLSELMPHVRVLFTSGYTDDAVVRHGVIESKTNFIQKPFRPEELATKVREVLDQG